MEWKSVHPDTALAMEKESHFQDHQPTSGGGGEEENWQTTTATYPWLFSGSGHEPKNAKLLERKLQV